MGFHTCNRLFEYTVIPFRLANAPTTIQNRMNEVRTEYLDQTVVVYYDDILIYLSSQGEHEVLVSKV